MGAAPGLSAIPAMPHITNAKCKMQKPGLGASLPGRNRTNAKCKMQKSGLCSACLANVLHFAFCILHFAFCRAAFCILHYFFSPYP
jgi:hypothetical protein